MVHYSIFRYQNMSSIDDRRSVIVDRLHTTNLFIMFTDKNIGPELYSLCFYGCTGREWVPPVSIRAQQDVVLVL